MKTFLLCLLAASFFWLMNALNKDRYTLRLDYPIHFQYDEEEYVPVAPLPKTVSVNVSGVGWNLLRRSWLKFARPPLEYQVTNPLRVSFINAESLTDKMAEHFPDLHVNYVVADTLELDFARKHTRVIPIRVDSTGLDMRPGFVVSSLINLTPSLISVEGPEEVVSRYPDTLLVRVPALKIQNNYDEVLSLDLPQLPNATVSHSSVLVSFEVARLLKPLPSDR